MLRGIGNPTPWPAIGVSKDVSVELSHGLCIDAVKTWIETCESHPICSSATKTKLPKRVLDLGPHRFRNTISLIETNDEVHDRYMTLSHCWGSIQPITTTKATLRQKKFGIRMSGLPQTSAMPSSSVEVLASGTCGSIRCVSCRTTSWTGNKSLRKWRPYTRVRI